MPGSSLQVSRSAARAGVGDRLPIGTHVPVGRRPESERVAERRLRRQPDEPRSTTGRATDEWLRRPMLFTTSGMSPQPHRLPISHPATQALTRAAMTAGGLLRDERIRRRMPMREVAARAGVSSAAVADVEAGNPASLETYARLATALGLRFDLSLADPRRRAPVARDVDAVHASMGEAQAKHLRTLGFHVDLDAPYQHYQFAGRADVVAWDLDRRSLLHLENRTRFPNLQETFGSYNSKRAYLGAELAARIGIGGGWRSETHVIVGLWSGEVLHSIRMRTSSFASVCPDPSDAFAAWWAGRPPGHGRISTVVVFDPRSDEPARHRGSGEQARRRSRRRRFIGLSDALRSDPRYRDYADAARALQRAPRSFDAPARRSS